jgi:predicted site-specific integrase-resolvase
LKGVKRTAGWLDHQDVCLKLKISKRTLQTLRDNGTLAYTKIGNRTYYLPEDVERIVTKVEDRRKDARYRGLTI